MRSKVINDTDGRTHMLVFDEGDAVMELLREFAAEHDLTGSHFTAIGAFSGATLAYFDWNTKEYNRFEIEEQVEVLTLSGNITRAEDKPKIHAHVVVGKADGTAHGGHLFEAHVRPTLELVLTETPQHLKRRHDPETGLTLIEP